MNRDQARGGDMMRATGSGMSQDASMHLQHRKDIPHKRNLGVGPLCIHARFIQGS